MPNEILTIREVAELLKINEKTAYKLERAAFG
jgi:predicted DNA-binding transcriptional regulator AlpA